MVRGDVRQDARVVRLVADAAQDDPAAGRLEHADLDVAPREDHRRAAGTRPVAGIDEPLVDEDPVRRGRPDAPAGANEDVGDQPRHRALPVGSTDRHDRDPPILVAEPWRRRRPRLGDPRGPPRDGSFLVAGQLGGPRRRHVALRERKRRLCDGPRPFFARPRERHDPVPGVRRAVDGDAADTLAVVGSKPADPRDDRGDRIGPGPRRDRGAEVARAHAGPAGARRRTCAGARWPARPSPPARAGRRWVPRAGGSRSGARSRQDSKRR